MLEQYFIYIIIIFYIQLDRRTLLEKVENTTKILHDGGFAHGDLRASNIMVSTDMKQMKIVDFDWGGKEEEVKNPQRLNANISWLEMCHAHEKKCNAHCIMRIMHMIFFQIVQCHIQEIHI